MHGGDENHAFADAAFRQRRSPPAGVMLMYSRCFFVRNVRYSVWNRILAIIAGDRTCYRLLDMCRGDGVRL